MATTVFRGFSTINGETRTDWSVYDIDLIKRDLLNHFHTRVGERVMRPDWGCRIWDWLMEPLTEPMREQIVAEAVRICREDPRVTVAGVNAIALDHGVRVEIALDLIPFGNLPTTISVDFEDRQSILDGLEITEY